MKTLLHGLLYLLGVALAATAILVLPKTVKAGVSCSVPFNLTNGTTADASQVMANYNAILTCLSASTAASGANSDITSILGLTTPLSAGQGGTTQYVGGTSAGTNTVTLANPSPNGFSYTAGNVVVFIIGGTNTGATTLNVNALGAKNVFKQTSSGPVALTGGEMVATQLVAAYYDGIQFEIAPANITPVGIGSVNTTNPPYGFDAPINLQLNASVGSNLLTIAIKGNNGNDPSTGNPVLIPFRDVTIANGGPVWVSVTAALSINTNAVGATLATANSVPFRIWVVAFNNSGTAVLALWQSVAGGSSPTAINSLNEATLQSTTGISAAATSAGTFYTPNGTTLTNKAFRILGYVDYASGLVTAGTYATAPTTVQLFGPGIKKPGEVMQVVYAQNAVASNNSSSTFAATNLTANITPTSTPNVVRVFASGALSSSNQATIAEARLLRSAGTTLFGPLAEIQTGAITTLLQAPCTLLGIDSPGAISQQTYSVAIASSNNSNAVNWSFGAINSTIELDEIQV